MVYIPLYLEPGDVLVALGQLYAEEVRPLLDRLEAEGCPPDRLEARATAYVDILAEQVFGTAEPGRRERWRAKLTLAWLALRRAWRPGPPPSQSAMGGFADLWVSMVYRGVARDRIPVILRSAVRAASVERQLARLVG